MSTAERLRKEGRAEGKAEGLALGEFQGRVATVLRLLQRRFGELPESIVQRVQTATIAELELWTDRVLDRKTLADVFAAE